MAVHTYFQTKWSLADLFPGYDSTEIKTAISGVEEKVANFESKRDLLSADITSEAFLDLVKKMENISRVAYRINSFADLWFYENTQNQEAQNFMARIDQLIADIQNRVLFFSLWWKELDDQQAERLMAEAGDYRYWLEEMRHFKPHTLSEPEEKIINIKNVTGINAMKTLYDTITNRYVYKMTVDGEVKELTRDSLMIYARDYDPDLRAA
ncbi:MAG: oligoendopeptidase F, partial [Anaerolineales bacterium]